ncbi:cation:proton antiporter regulatory subunit [Halorubrum depositum]|uniref:cation:proton antiporter regulatory subunit n=1 Tax=Halorubrum depositum TaxID=2583992 RepID=UPI0011A9F0BE|nr:TrkA C-terminal domain-containing protein [Halorubrum depositum]
MASAVAVAPPVDVGFARPRQAAVTLVTFAVLSILVAGAAALTYRWYFRDEIPEGVTVLLGVSVVALYLNTTSLGAIAAGESPSLLEPESVFFNVVSLGVAAVFAPGGRYVGDRLAVDVFALSGARQLEGELSGIVRAVGRFTAVTLPSAEEIKDMDTYDPVSPEKKAEMAEKTLLFARKLSGEELRERLVERVKSDHGVGYVDVDVTDDGEIEYFAVGSRAAGLGPTLAPGSAAVAVAADPPNNATAGDAVQLWRTDPEPKRIATGELRGVAGDAATVALDESDAEGLTEEESYRIVTLPSEPQADREFASLLRNADETMAAITVGAGSALAGSTVGDVEVVVAAVRPENGSVQPIPRRGYAFGAGDLVYLVGRPDALRRFEADAGGERADPSSVTPTAGSASGREGVEPSEEAPETEPSAGDTETEPDDGDRTDTESEAGEGTQRS